MFVNSEISWAPGYHYAELSPLIPAEHIDADLLELALTDARTNAPRDAKAKHIFTCLVEIALRTADQAALDDAWQYYESLPQQSPARSGLGNYNAALPLYEARSFRRQPNRDELAAAHAGLWGLLRNQRNNIYEGRRGVQQRAPNISYDSAGGRVANLRGQTAETITMLLGIYNFQRGKGDILLPSSSREEAPRHDTIAACGRLQHDLHSFNPDRPTERKTIGVKTEIVRTANQMPEFRLITEARLALRAAKARELEDDETIRLTDIITNLEIAEHNPGLQYYRRFKNVLADRLLYTMHLSQAFRPTQVL